MIFVTVGTHDQPFDRLVVELDRAVAAGELSADLFFQIGEQTREPRGYPFSRFLPYEEMVASVQRADLVISHGGPASLMLAMQAGKPLIAVPRMRQFHEHVNDHQVDFVRRLAADGRLTAIYDMRDLVPAIQRLLQAPVGTQAGINPRVDQLVTSLEAYARQIGLTPVAR